VVSPQPWFPFQSWLRRWRPHFRPDAPRYEVQDGVPVYRPRFLSVPGFFKSLDGLSMAVGSYLTLRRLRRDPGVTVLDAHFAYPDGYAATRLGRWLGVPVTITLRGTEVPHSTQPRLRARLVRALQAAQRVFAVSESLRRHAVSLGIPGEKIRVVGNGVDTDRFRPMDRQQARRRHGLPPEARVLVSVGALVERKGFHRVIECLPELLAREPHLRYLVVGGASPEGDMGAELRAQVRRLGLDRQVLFLGPVPPDALKWLLSAADVFVLATRNEGWANVFLEAMACGLPVVTTDVGGNAEVVCRPELGRVVPYGDAQALTAALGSALEQDWDREAIRAYALANSWESRVSALVEEFTALAGDAPQAASARQPAFGSGTQ